MKILYFFLISFSLSSCTGENYSANERTSEATASSDIKTSYASNTQQQDEKIIVQEPVLIKNASIRFQVEDYKEATEKINSFVKEVGGYIASSNETNTGYSLENMVVIRVEAKKYDELISKLLSLSIYLNYNNMKVEDVTEEYIDLQTRLKNKRELEKKYVEFLKQAKNVEEILNIEREINNIRSEIEAKEGRLKYLLNRAQYSTIELIYYQTYDEIRNQPTRKFLARLGEGFINGWEAFLNFVIILANGWVFILLVTIGVIVGLRYARAKVKK